MRHGIVLGLMALLLLALASVAPLRAEDENCTRFGMELECNVPD